MKSERASDLINVRFAHFAGSSQTSREVRRSAGSSISVALARSPRRQQRAAWQTGRHALSIVKQLSDLMNEAGVPRRMPSRIATRRKPGPHDCGYLEY